MYINANTICSVHILLLVRIGLSSYGLANTFLQKALCCCSPDSLVACNSMSGWEWGSCGPMRELNK